MIIGIEGGISAGKTLTMTKFLVDEYRNGKRNLMGNYHVRLPGFNFLEWEDFVKMAVAGEGFERAAFGLDEAHVWFDSRRSISQANLLMSYWTLQTGKEGINLYYTTQHFRQVDKRLRDRTDIAIWVRRVGDWHKLKIVDTTGEKIRSYNAAIYGPDYRQFYDTKEVVKPKEAGAIKRKMASEN